MTWYIWSALAFSSPGVSGWVVFTLRQQRLCQQIIRWGRTVPLYTFYLFHPAIVLIRGAFDLRKITSTASFWSVSTPLTTMLQTLCMRILQTVERTGSVNCQQTWPHSRQPLLTQCTAEVSPSHQSVRLIYKWANRGADNSLHACDELIRVQRNWIQLPGWALIPCHWNKATLLRSDQSDFFNLAANELLLERFPWT